MNNYECQESSVLGVHEDRWELVRKSSLAQLHLPRFWFLSLRWATYKLFVSFFSTLEEVVNFTQIVDLCDHHHWGTEESHHPNGLTLAMFTDSPPHSPGKHQSSPPQSVFPSWVWNRTGCKLWDCLLSFRAMPPSFTQVVSVSVACSFRPMPLSFTQVVAVSIACSFHCWLCPWWGRATAHQLNPGRTSGLFPSLGDCLK